jgi:hypothetical protein
MSKISLLFCKGGIAQLGERLHGMQEVSGSIPLTSTTTGQQTESKKYRFKGTALKQDKPRTNSSGLCFLSGLYFFHRRFFAARSSRTTITAQAA